MFRPYIHAKTGYYMTLKRTLYTLLICCASFSILQAQCDGIQCGKGFGKMLDNGITTIPIYVNGVINDDLSDINQGVFGVYLDFKHPNIGETRMYLESPDGNKVQLTGNAIMNAPANIGTRWNVCFRPNSIMVENPSGYDAVWDNANNWGFGTYHGSYWPYSGALEDFSTGPVNGIWKLIIEDISIFGVGEIFDFSLSFFDENGIACTDCLNDAGELSLTKDTLCLGEPISNDIITHSYSTIVPNSELHTILYEIINGDTVIEIDSIIDFSTYEVGVYTICGLSVFNRDLAHFELSNVNTSLVDLLLSDENICAERTDECLDIYIIEAAQVESIKIDLCEGEVYEYKGTLYSESGLYYINEGTIYCEEITILDIQTFDSDYSIKSLGTSVLSCSIPIVFLQVEHEQENLDYFSYWYTNNGYINAVLQNNDLVEVNRAGTYHYVWSNGSCTDTIEFEVTSTGDIPIVDILYEFINCDSVSLSFDSNKDIVEIEWLLSDGNIVIDLSLEVGTTLPGVNTLRVIDEDNCVAITNLNIPKFGSFGEIELKLDSLNCVNDIVQPIISTNTSIDSLLWTGVDFESKELIPDISNSGLYNVYVYSDEGCDTLLNFEIIESYKLENYSIEFEDWNCNSDSVYVELLIDKEDVLFEWINSDNIPISDMNGFYAKDTGFYYLSMIIDDCEYLDTIRIINSNDYPVLLNWEIDTINCTVDSALIDVSYLGEDLIFHWTGPNDFDSVINSPYVYTIGDYYLEVSNEFGCSVIDTFVVIGSDDIPSFEVGDNTISCIEDSMMIDIQVSGIIESILWTGPDGFESEVLTPYVYKEGTYMLDVISEAGCHNSIFVDVDKLGSNLSIILEADTLDCIRADVNIFSNIELSSIKNFEWSGPNFSTSEMLNPEGIIEPGWYYLNIIDIDNCSVIDSIEVIKDIIAPVANGGGNRSFICSDTIILDGSNSILNDDIEIEWTSNGSLEILNNKTLNPTIFEIGTYYLSLFDGNNGCEDFDTIEVIEEEDISVYIGMDTIVAMGSLMDFELTTNESLDNLDEIIWTGLENFSCINCSEIQFNARNSISLSVLIKNKSGCTATTSVKIEVVEVEHVYFPSIFTPNSENSSGFYLSYKPSIDKVVFAQIYDRWGNLLYEHTNYDPIATNFNWDGTFRGQLVDSGVYVVVVKYKLLSGDSFTEAQTLTLIR